jgi:hypothetical protein
LWMVQLTKGPGSLFMGERQRKLCRGFLAQQSQVAES